MNFSIEKYLVIGPENTLGRPVEDVVEAAVKGGFTFIQIRSKVASAKELISICKKTADKIASLGKSNEVALVVNDRLDIVLACVQLGIKIDGIHVGQSDIPVDICRHYLGEDSIIGLSAPTKDLLEYVKKADVKNVDYFGAGPVHETATKPDCGMGEDGKVHTLVLDELAELSKLSPVPVVVGGGVKVTDLPAMKKNGIQGFFLVSAVAAAENPFEAAKELCDNW